MRSAGLRRIAIFGSERAKRGLKERFIFFLPQGAPKSEKETVQEGSKTQAVPRKRPKELTRRFKVTPLRPQAAPRWPKHVFSMILNGNLELGTIKNQALTAARA